MKSHMTSLKNAKALAEKGKLDEAKKILKSVLLDERQEEFYNAFMNDGITKTKIVLVNKVVDELHGKSYNLDPLEGYVKIPKYGYCFAGASRILYTSYTFGYEEISNEYLKNSIEENVRMYFDGINIKGGEKIILNRKEQKEFKNQSASSPIKFNQSTIFFNSSFLSDCLELLDTNIIYLHQDDNFVKAYMQNEYGESALILPIKIYP